MTKKTKFDGYSIADLGEEGVDLDVDSYDSYYGACIESLDAVEVYKNLKEFFKGTKYE